MQVGLQGASTIHVLCEAEICNNLFDKIKSRNNSIVIDRLYRKIVRLEDVSELQSVLSRLISGDFDKTQKELIEKILKALTFFHDCAEHDLEKYGDYTPLRIMLIDLPYSVLDDNIPLEDYDNNDGEPFWMRPEYIIEKYSKVKKG